MNKNNLKYLLEFDIWDYSHDWHWQSKTITFFANKPASVLTSALEELNKKAEEYNSIDIYSFCSEYDDRNILDESLLDLLYYAGIDNILWISFKKDVVVTIQKEDEELVEMSYTDFMKTEYYKRDHKEIFNGEYEFYFMLKDQSNWGRIYVDSREDFSTLILELIKSEVKDLEYVNMDSKSAAWLVMPEKKNQWTVFQWGYWFGY